MMRKLEIISGLLQENCICRHHMETRVKLYVPREESFLIPMKYIDNTRNTHTSLDVMMEKILKITGTWMGEREVSDAWSSGFHKIHCIE